MPMDEKFVRQFDYKANSNLVLPTDKDLIDRRPSNEATGEVQSLAGRIVGRMGDKLTNKSDAKPTKTEQDDRKKRKESKRRKDDSSAIKIEHQGQYFSVADVGVEELLYQPGSEMARAAYGLIAKFVKDYIDFSNETVINATADEVINTMKDPNLDEESRRAEIESLLLPGFDSASLPNIDELLSDDRRHMRDERYNELCNLCKKITDWGTSRAKVKEDTTEAADGEVGVILPDDDDEMSDDLLSEVHDTDDEFDLDDMFEKAAEVSEALNIEELAKKQSNIVPRVEIGEPVKREGYHEYRIEPKRSASKKQHNLIKIDDLSEYERYAFKGFKNLNIIQSMIYKKVMTTDKSLLICAPTGAGKTNIALLAMLKEIITYRKSDGTGFDTDKFKIIYVAPIKALVQEIVENFSERLNQKPFGLTVRELTGDSQLNQKEISEAQIIVCTPEKWDIVTRKSLDRLYTKVVRLVIFDEIHLLHNERGATLEALVARIKRHKQIEGEKIRIIGLSATLPNYKDVARFIAPDETEEESTFYFDSTYRPVPLTQLYIALTESKRSLRLTNDIVYEKVIERLSGSAQVLVFVHSRPDTMKTAEFIKFKAIEENKLGLFLSSSSSVDTIKEECKILPESSKLKEPLLHGIGFHHAGLSKDERSCVERLYRMECIKVLVSTATLAWGVNLPARTVIIKGTQVYRDGRWTDLDSLDVTQMLGRAGRSKSDREAEGIVITQQSQVAFYISLMTEQLPVESRLIGRLADCVNAECVIGNIESMDGAVNWLNETYLSSRMASVLKQENRQYMLMYGISNDSKSTDPKLTNHKYNLAYNAVSILDDRGLIVFDRSSGFIKSTELGRIASDFNCSSRTIKLFSDSIHEHTSDIELLRTFSLADEFKDIFVRRGEEADLMTLINRVPYPIDDKKATPGANKVNALLQVYIFRLNIEGSDLICDMHFIKDNAARLVRAIHDIVLMKGYANVAEISFDLCRKIDKRMTVCHSPLRQFPDLDATLVNNLEKKNYHIEELRLLDVEKLTELLRCHRSEGKKVYRSLRCLPKLKLDVVIKPIIKGSLRVELNVKQDFEWSSSYHGYTETFWLLVEDVNQEALLHCEMIKLRKNSLRGVSATFHIPYLMPAQPFYYIRVLPEKWFGCDHHKAIYLDNLTLPEEPPIVTQLLDLEPQTIRSLANPLFERFYEDKFKGSSFNQIQTQAFKHIYKSSDDLILLASAGCGKTVCAELAVIRNINLHGTGSKCGYIAANRQAAESIYTSWKSIFGERYGLLLLTGKRRDDAAKVEGVNIVIGEPESWHSLTLMKAKTKKYRKMMESFQLFVIDDIHILHSDYGTTLEWLCAKLRILTKNSPKHPARIVALGSPLAGAESLKNWLAFERGSREPIVLNYPPSVRPVKLELNIQKYRHYDYSMRLLSMQRPIYRLITQVAKERPSLIFVADYGQVLKLCVALINYSKGEKKRFASPRVDERKINESPLKECLRYGIGFLYRGMYPSDRSLVEDLYNREQIMVLVCTVSMCWSIQVRSYLTIVMDTQQHHGSEVSPSTSDHELTDIMQMVGLTGRPLTDHECKCYIMCETSKSDYYDRFLREPLAVESNLPANLASHVNYEVVAGTISELNDIYKPFLAHTYFYKRITINPNYYGVIVPGDQEGKTETYKTYFNDLVTKVAERLSEKEFLTMEEPPENPKFTAGLLAMISLEYYISYETLVKYSDWFKNSKSSQLGKSRTELIEVISTNTHEFRQIQVKHNEIEPLKRLQRKYKCQMDDKINSTLKVKLLLLSQYQKTDGREEPLEGELIEDRYFVITLSHRLLMAISDIALLQDSFASAKSAIQLAKKLVLFSRSSRPDLDMDISISKTLEDEEDEQGGRVTRIAIDINIERKDVPFSFEEFQANYPEAPNFAYRDEGWYFLVHGKLIMNQGEHDSTKGISRHLDREKFQYFKRVKTPVSGRNEYKVEFELSEHAAASYSNDLYFMSDFYPTGQDRQVQLELQQ